MRTRLVTRLLRARLRQFPAVALLGPRQCGKTTLARALGARYYDAERRRNGRFLLLGSVSPGLRHEVSESLAGRIARIEMTPFLLPELRDTCNRDTSIPYAASASGNRIRISDQGTDTRLSSSRSMRPSARRRFTSACTLL